MGREPRRELQKKVGHPRGWTWPAQQFAGSQFYRVGDMTTTRWRFIEPHGGEHHRESWPDSLASLYMEATGVQGDWHVLLREIVRWQLRGGARRPFVHVSDSAIDREIAVQRDKDRDITTAVLYLVTEDIGTTSESGPLPETRWSERWRKVGRDGLYHVAPPSAFQKLLESAEWPATISKVVLLAHPGDGASQREVALEYIDDVKSVFVEKGLEVDDYRINRSSDSLGEAAQKAEENAGELRRFERLRRTLTNPARETLPTEKWLTGGVSKVGVGLHGVTEGRRPEGRRNVRQMEWVDADIAFAAFADYLVVGAGGVSSIMGRSARGLGATVKQIRHPDDTKYDILENTDDYGNGLGTSPPALATEWNAPNANFLDTRYRRMEYSLSDGTWQKNFQHPMNVMWPRLDGHEGYRIGDMVSTGWRWSEPHGERYTRRTYPDSLATLYMDHTNVQGDWDLLLRCVFKWTLRGGARKPFRYVTEGEIDLEVATKKWCVAQAPKIAVVQLRTGDVCEDPQPDGTQRGLEANDFLREWQWYGPNKFYYTAPLSEYEKILGSPEWPGGIDEIVLMSNPWHGNDHGTVSLEYVRGVKAFFEGKGFKVDDCRVQALHPSKRENELPPDNGHKRKELSLTVNHFRASSWNPSECLVQALLDQVKKASAGDVRNECRLTRLCEGADDDIVFAVTKADCLVVGVGGFSAMIGKLAGLLGTKVYQTRHPRQAAHDINDTAPSGDNGLGDSLPELPGSTDELSSVKNMLDARYRVPLFSAAAVNGVGAAPPCFDKKEFLLWNDANSTYLNSNAVDDAHAWHTSTHQLSGTQDNLVWVLQKRHDGYLLRNKKHKGYLDSNCATHIACYGPQIGSEPENLTWLLKDAGGGMYYLYNMGRGRHPGRYLHSYTGTLGVWRGRSDDDCGHAHGEDNLKWRLVPPRAQNASAPTKEPDINIRYWCWNYPGSL